MLDWKNRGGRLGGGTADPALDGPTTGRWRLLQVVAAVVVVYLLATIVLGWYWSREPDRFAVQRTAREAAEASGRQLVNGYTTVETLKQVAETLLDKPGGYLTNDIAPPGLWLDNMPSWEYGVLVQVRDLTRALRKDFARSQSQSTEDPDLARGEPLFHFDNRSWALPATESEYRQGILALDRYLARLSDPAPKALFYTRADNLNNWLGDVAPGSARCPSGCRPASGACAWISRACPRKLRHSPG